MLNKLITRISFGFCLPLGPEGDELWIYEVIDRLDKTRMLLCNNRTLVTPMLFDEIPDRISDDIVPFLSDIREMILARGFDGDDPIVWEAMATLIDKLKEAGSLVGFDCIRVDIPLSENHVFQVYYQTSAKGTEGSYLCSNTEICIPITEKPSALDVMEVLIAVASDLDPVFSRKLQRLTSARSARQ